MAQPERAKRQRVNGAVGFDARWFIENCGFTYPDPLVAGPALLVEQEMERKRALRQHFPDLPVGDPDPKPVPHFRGIDCGQMLHCAFGGSFPRWMPETNTWWHDRSFCPWADVETLDDVRRIQVPRWEGVSEIERVFHELAEWQRVFPDQEVPFDYSCYHWRHPNTGQWFRFSYVQSFIDLGPYLMGAERFFALLASQPDVGRALMEKGFEIATSLSDYLRARTGNPPVVGLNPLVGNFGTFMSPRLYEQYSLSFDLMTLERYGRDLPCNLHSCGPSAQLYDYWSEFPNVVWMQTRGIPGQLSRLRKALPKTHLQITLHPPQFEFELATPEEVRAAVWRHAEEVGFRDVSLVVMVAGYGGDGIERNVRAFYSALDEVNASAAL